MYFPLRIVFTSLYCFYDLIVDIRPQYRSFHLVMHFPICIVFTNLYCFYDLIVSSTSNCLFDARYVLVPRFEFSFSLKLCEVVNNFPCKLYIIISCCFVFSGIYIVFTTFVFIFCEFKMFLPLSTVFSTLLSFLPCWPPIHLWHIKRACCCCIVDSEAWLGQIAPPGLLVNFH